MLSTVRVPGMCATLAEWHASFRVQVKRAHQACTPNHTGSVRAGKRKQTYQGAHVNVAEETDQFRYCYHISYYFTVVYHTNDVKYSDRC